GSSARRPGCNTNFRDVADLKVWRALPTGSVVNLPVDFHRVLPIAAIGLVAIVAGLLVVHGLGGSSSGGSSASSGPAQVLDQTFSGHGASSGKFEVTAAVALQGVPAPAANPF